jgi:hypothetical protein
VGHRERFGLVLNARGLRGEAVELGTFEGRFAASFLQHWGGRLLTCVDPWRAGYDDRDPASSADMEQALAAARAVMAKFGERSRLLRMTGHEAAGLFPSGVLDFVYIDARHREEDVRRDIADWWPKLKSGGILAGHDLVNPEDPGPRGEDLPHGWELHVQPAVFGFAEQEGLELWVVSPMDEAWSWWFNKP